MFWNYIFEVTELLNKQKSQLYLTKVLTNGYFTTLYTYLLELKSLTFSPIDGCFYCDMLQIMFQLQKSYYNNNCYFYKIKLYRGSLGLMLILP